MKRACVHCSSNFDIHQEDLDFLEKVSPRINGAIHSIPAPTRCPSCRRVRRYAWRNERVLFQRNCDFSGEKIISALPPTVPFPVYKNSYWWSDAHDGLSYGREIDFKRSMFEQIAELQRVVPQPHSFNFSDERQENSSYTNCTGDMKSCYLVFGADRDELCMYSTYINDSYRCVDCMFCLHCTNCYECIDIEHCNSIFYSENCKECFDSYWLYDCRSTRNCIGCVGLRQKQFHILNSPVSKEEYFETLQSIQSGNQSVIEHIKNGVASLLKRIPRKSFHGDHNENCSGDYIWSSKNCRECYDVANAWDCAYCTWFVAGKDCMDVYSWGDQELCYEVCAGGDKHYGCAFTVKSFGCKECFYTDLCMYSKNCFACVGLKNAQYCILNKQYSKNEYEALIPQIINLMQSHGEWGELFPSKNSPWGYNESVAIQYHPLSKEEALAQNFSWNDYAPPIPQATTISPNVLLRPIEEIKDDLLKSAIACEETGRAFKVIPQELDFYISNKLPIPKKHHDVRHQHRLRQRNPRKLFNRFCEKCGENIQSTYEPTRPEVVYCEPCYLGVIY